MNENKKYERRNIYVSKSHVEKKTWDRLAELAWSQRTNVSSLLLDLAEKELSRNGR